MSDESEILQTRKQYDRITARIEKKKTEMASLVSEQRALKKQLQDAAKKIQKESEKRIAAAEAELARIRIETESESSALSEFFPKQRASKNTEG